VIGKFVRGFVDGSLSTLGIVIGASAASSWIIVAAGVGGALANGVSNVLGALSAERIDQYRELREVERAMVSQELKGSALDGKIRKETVAAGMVDGLATMAGGAIPILPYLALDPDHAVFVSIALVIVEVFVLGLYLGKLSRENIVFSAVKMAVFAMAIAVIVYVVQSVIVP